MYHQNGAIIHTQSQRRFHRWQFYLLELKFLMTIIFFILIKCFLTLRKHFSIYQPRTLRESSKNHWYCYLYLQNAFPVSVHVLISKMCDIFTAKHPATVLLFTGLRSRWLLVRGPLFTMLCFLLLFLFREMRLKFCCMYLLYLIYFFLIRKS